MRIKATILTIVLVLIGLFLLGGSVFSEEEPEPLGLVKGLATLKGNRKKYVDSFVESYPLETSWYPLEKVGTAIQPEIVGAAAVLVDIDSGKVLFEKNSTEKKPIASLVKIMTAVVALEHASLEDEFEVSLNASRVGENSMELSWGEIYTLEELLYGLILHSGNDASYAIAEGIAGDDKTFVEWMNFKATELGLVDTHFADPCGLDDKTYSTPMDLVKLTRYAVKNPKFRKIVSTVETEVYSDTHKYMYLYNQTNLLTTYPGVSGVKTGYTEEAGLCLVTYAENEGVEVVGVVLNSTDRKGDMILMLDHGFSTMGVTIKHDLL